MNIGKMMKEIRTYDLTTQTVIAENLGISSNTYIQYERQYAIIPIKHLNTFCNYFSVSIDYMFELTKTKTYGSIAKDVNKSIAGERLKSFRKELGLTQEKLAAILKVDRSLISDYEKGKNVIATPFLYTICKKYQVSADWLLGRVDKPKYLR